MDHRAHRRHRCAATQRVNFGPVLAPCTCITVSKDLRTPTGGAGRRTHHCFPNQHSLQDANSSTAVLILRFASLVMRTRGCRWASCRIALQRFRLFRAPKSGRRSSTSYQGEKVKAPPSHSALCTDLRNGGVHGLLKRLNVCGRCLDGQRMYANRLSSHQGISAGKLRHLRTSPEEKGSVHSIGEAKERCSHPQVSGKLYC